LVPLFFAAGTAPDFGLFMQKYVQQGGVNLRVAVVIDKTKLTGFNSCNHLSDRLLTDLRGNLFRLASRSKLCPVQ
jgi:hypothetical protein